MDPLADVAQVLEPVVELSTSRATQAVGAPTCTPAPSVVGLLPLARMEVTDFNFGIESGCTDCSRSCSCSPGAASMTRTVGLGHRLQHARSPMVIGCQPGVDGGARASSATSSQSTWGSAASQAKIDVNQGCEGCQPARQHFPSTVDSHAEVSRANHLPHAYASTACHPSRTNSYVLILAFFSNRFRSQNHRWRYYIHNLNSSGYF